MVTRLITGLFFILATHFTTSYAPLSPVVSTTNADSVYYPSVGHVGTISDSLGDSVFFPIQFATVQSGGFLDISFCTNSLADTNCDSVIVLQNHVVLSRLKVVKNTTSLQVTNFYGPFTVTSNTPFNPELFEVIPKWKVKAGKGAHTLRVRPVYTAQ